jgi:hypothetical protein
MLLQCAQGGRPFSPERLVVHAEASCEGTVSLWSPRNAELCDGCARCHKCLITDAFRSSAGKLGRRRRAKTGDAASELRPRGFA